MRASVNGNAIAKKTDGVPRREKAHGLHLQTREEPGWNESCLKGTNESAADIGSIASIRSPEIWWEGLVDKAREDKAVWPFLGRTAQFKCCERIGDVLGRQLTRMNAKTGSYVGVGNNVGLEMREDGIRAGAWSQGVSQEMVA